MSTRSPVMASVALSAALLLAIGAVGCKGCGKGASEADAAPSPAVLLNRVETAPDAGPGAQRDLAMWSNARSLEVEDLAALAVHEGAAGLVEAASIPELTETALRAMAYADGYAQLPMLAAVAQGKNDERAALALDAAITLGQRRRAQAESDDGEELSAGCASLTALANDKEARRERRVAAIRAVRTLPCDAGQLPHDLDAR